MWLTTYSAMFTFPQEIASSVFQYPTSRETHFVTQVLAFVGGKEQRYALSGAPLRIWTAKPTLLDDTVWAKLAAFFELVGGTAQPFAFTDPWDRTTYPACYFATDSFASEMREQGQTAVSFAVVEARVEA